MKIINILWIPVACLLLSCEHDVAMETVVHEDGSLDRSIVVQSSTSSPEKSPEHMFAPGILRTWRHEKLDLPTKDTGARPAVEEGSPDTAVNTDYMERLTQHFESAEAANREMNTDDDFFHVESHFEKKFRWFYTYMVYSDTYKALWRYKRVPLSDYFTAEDYAFVQRLPAESKKISKADSIYLDQLMAKCEDKFMARAYFEEYYANLEDIVRREIPDKRAMDSLTVNKERLFNFAKNEDPGDSSMLAALDSIGVHLSGEAREQYVQWTKTQERKLEIMTQGYAGKYVHHIQMPWPVVSNNADSIVGNSLFWKPPVLKFLLTDYTMRAESRRLNYWAVVVSGLFIVVAGVLVFRRRGLS